ncbi:MAG: DUF2510 domain-containing protein [Acidimicrobiales bacterium]
MKVEQVETADGVILRSSPTDQEWQRTRLRLILAAVACTLVGAALSALEFQAGVKLLALGLLPAAVGLGWAARLVVTLVRARPTAVVATDHSLRLERVDGSRNEDLDLGGVSSIRIGPDGFSPPWRWLKGPRSGLVVVRLRANGQGLVIPPQLAGHPVVRQLLARMLAASRARGPVNLTGPRALVSELEQLALSAEMPGHGQHIPPITIPAGWYPDPSGVAPLRWWDGRAWADYTRETPPA